jgi:ADP-ribose pyrophosphatase YjhB (NUDIX family)
MVSRAYPDRPIVGVGVVVRNGHKVLLIERAKPPRRGHWSLPGGLQRLGETVAAAAIREVKEETGVSVALAGLLDVVDSVERDSKNRVRRHYTLVDFAADWRGGKPKAGGDAAAVKWFSLEEIDGLDLWAETRRVIRLAAARRA